MKPENPSTINREMTHEEWADFTRGWTWKDWEDFDTSGRGYPLEDDEQGEGETESIGSEEELPNARQSRPGEGMVFVGSGLVANGAILAINGDSRATILLAAGVALVYVGIARADLSS